MHRIDERLCSPVDAKSRDEVVHHRIVVDYKYHQSKVVLGDLSEYDAVAIIMSFCPFQGHEVYAFGYEVEYMTE